MPALNLVDAMGQTTVPGVYAAGDVTTRVQQVAMAVSTGTAAGAMINHELVRTTSTRRRKPRRTHGMTERGSGMDHVVIWQNLWWPGAEWCELQPVSDGWRIAGTALAAVEGTPWQLHYAIALDEAWTTREVDVTARVGALERHLRLAASRERIWRIERRPEGRQPGDELPALRGLHDIDLGFSPATNTLPIRRLAPAIGESIDVAAVWLRFPELTIEPLPQRYTRLDERRYRYESRGGAFVAQIEVDEQGVVVSYESGWQRVAGAS